MVDEVWKPVLGYEGSYSVSNMGRVRSEARAVHHPNSGVIRLKGRVLKQVNVTFGYKAVELSASGIGTLRLVHSLVLESFVGPRPQSQEACHNDSDPTNNCLSNLRWDTRSGNFADKLANGTAQRGSNANNSRLSDVSVLAIRADTRAARLIAADYGVTPHHIRALKRGDAWAWL